MKRDKQQIIDECIESIMSGSSTIEECLFWLDDEIRDEVEPILIATTRLLSDADVKPNQARKQSSRDKLIAAVDEKRWESGIERKVLLTKQTRKSPRRLMVRLAIVLSAMMALSGATVAMADQSLPGSPLYPVKRAVENAKIGLTFNDGEKRLLYMQAAERRMDELDKLKSDDRNYSKIIDDMTDSLEKAAGSSTTQAAGEDTGQNQINDNSQNQVNKKQQQIQSQIDKRLGVIGKRSIGALAARLNSVSPETKAIIEKKLKRLEKIAIRKESKSLKAQRELLQNGALKSTEDGLSDSDKLKGNRDVNNRDNNNQSSNDSNKRVLSDKNRSNSLNNENSKNSQDMSSATNENSGNEAGGSNSSDNSLKKTIKKTIIRKNIKNETSNDASNNIGSSTNGNKNNYRSNSNNNDNNGNSTETKQEKNRKLTEQQKEILRKRLEKRSEIN